MRRGVLAGVRYLARDRLLGPMTLTVVVLDGAAGGIAVAVPLVAYTRYGHDVHVAGWLFTSFGVGAIIGSVLDDEAARPGASAAARVLSRSCSRRSRSGRSPLRFHGPPLARRWSSAASSSRSVNAPILGMISTRPPAALRAKVLTAVMTASGLGSPFGRLAVGPVSRRLGQRRRVDR